MKTDTGAAVAGEGSGEEARQQNYPWPPTPQETSSWNTPDTSCLSTPLAPPISDSWAGPLGAHFGLFPCLSPQGYCRASLYLVATPPRLRF